MPYNWNFFVIFFSPSVGCFLSPKSKLSCQAGKNNCEKKGWKMTRKVSKNLGCTALWAWELKVIKWGFWKTWPRAKSKRYQHELCFPLNGKRMCFSSKNHILKKHIAFRERDTNWFWGKFMVNIWFSFLIKSGQVSSLKSAVIKRIRMSFFRT